MIYISMAVVKYQERGWDLIAIASFFLELCFRIRISRYVGDEKNVLSSNFSSQMSIFAQAMQLAL